MSNLLTLALVLVGLVLATVGFEFGDAWPYRSGQILGLAGIVLSAWAAYRQFRESRPYVQEFPESCWQPATEGYVIEIPAATHKKGKNATATTFARQNAGYEEVVCSCETSASGTVIIGVSRPLDGLKVVIR